LISVYIVVAIITSHSMTLYVQILPIGMVN